MGIFLTNLVGRMGRPAVTAFFTARSIVQLVLETFLTAMAESRHGLNSILGVARRQTFFTGWQALPLIGLLAITTGFLVVFNAGSQSSLLGSRQIGQVLYLVAIRELGPILTALIVIARSGTAVASELGNMRANREIDALRSLAIPPLSFIVFPRFIGGMVSLFCLVFYFDVITFISGSLLSYYLFQIPVGDFAESFLVSVTGGQLALILTKNLLNGIIVFSICCFQGLQVKKGAHEVPQVTTKAVVASITSVTFLDFSLSLVWYLGGSI